MRISDWSSYVCSSDLLHDFIPDFDKRHFDSCRRARRFAIPAGGRNCYPSKWNLGKSNPDPRSADHHLPPKVATMSNSEDRREDAFFHSVGPRTPQSLPRKQRPRAEVLPVPRPGFRDQVSCVRQRLGMEEFQPKEVMMAEPLSHSEGLLELIRVDFVVSFAASLPAPLQPVVGVAMIFASTWAAWRTFRVLLSWRSEERRVGNVRVSTSSYRWSLSH